VIAPLSGRELAEKLKECHLYLTGARYEPGGNHYIEAMLCGLPVMYIESGSSGEYCSSWGGIGFTPVDFEDKLLQAYKAFPKNNQVVLGCPYNADWMGKQYEELFLRMIEESPRRQCRSKPIRYLLKKTVGRMKALISSSLRKMIG
jgi:hypothetical protein